MTGTVRKLRPYLWLNKLILRSSEKVALCFLGIFCDKWQVWKFKNFYKKHNMDLNLDVSLL